MSDGKIHKSKAALDKLTPAEQQAIFQRIESSDLKTAAKYIAAEYGLRLAENTISRWAMKMRFRKHLSERVEVIVRARESADEIMAQIGSSESIDKANLAMVGQKFMDAQLTNDPLAYKAFAETYTSLIDAMAKSRRADAAVKDSETSRRKFEFDAAKLVLKHFEELNAIRQSGGSDQEKQAQVVERLFGKPPVQEAQP